MADYKHADPTHLAFGRSGDSALLAKRRQNFDSGGEVAGEIVREGLSSREGPTLLDAKGKPTVTTSETYDPVTGTTAGVPNMATRADPTGKKLEHYNTVTGALMDPATVRSAPSLPAGARNEPVQESGPAPHIRSGKGTARVDMKKYPGWPQMG
jgi:hypothetical protein